MIISSVDKLVDNGQVSLKILKYFHAVEHRQEDETVIKKN